MEAAVTLLMGVKTPDLCTDVMAAGRMIHEHGALLSEFVPATVQGGEEHA